VRFLDTQGLKEEAVSLAYYSWHISYGILVIARFLDTQGLKEEAVSLATDADYKFELALQLGKLELAFKIGTYANTTWPTLLAPTLLRSTVLRPTLFGQA
jgi:hypothetical protein